MTQLEETRATELLEAQTKAEQLFAEIEARDLIRPGITESSLNADIYALAEEMYGIDYLLAQANRARGQKYLAPLRGKSTEPDAWNR